MEVVGTDDCESWMKARQLIRPDDQLELTEAELSEEVPKVLTTSYANVVKNLVVYSFKDGGFVNVPLPGTTITLFEVEGTALHIDSEEAKVQMADCREEGEEQESCLFVQNFPSFLAFCQYNIFVIFDS